MAFGPSNLSLHVMDLRFCCKKSTRTYESVYTFTITAEIICRTCYLNSFVTTVGSGVLNVISSGIIKIQNIAELIFEF
ncbi:hypothetical protein D3C72_2040380 [compost metagenome]